MKWINSSWFSVWKFEGLTRKLKVKNEREGTPILDYYYCSQCTAPAARKRIVVHCWSLPSTQGRLKVSYYLWTEVDGRGCDAEMPLFVVIQASAQVTCCAVPACGVKYVSFICWIHMNIRRSRCIGMDFPGHLPYHSTVLKPLSQYQLHVDWDQRCCKPGERKRKSKSKNGRGWLCMMVDFAWRLILMAWALAAWLRRKERRGRERHWEKRREYRGSLGWYRNATGGREHTKLILSKRISFQQETKNFWSCMVVAPYCIVLAVWFAVRHVVLFALW